MAGLMRSAGTRRNGSSFFAEEIVEVWKKGRRIKGENPDALRLDACGALISFEEYGNTDSKHGWEIDHNKPVAKGGTDDLENLFPLQWENNRHKSDNHPSWICLVT
jgi:hypothetical protein